MPCVTGNASARASTDPYSFLMVAPSAVHETKIGYVQEIQRRDETKCIDAAQILSAYASLSQRKMISVSVCSKVRSRRFLTRVRMATKSSLRVVQVAFSESASCCYSSGSKRGVLLYHRALTLRQQLIHVRFGSFSTEPADLDRRSTSASLRKRPNRWAQRNDAMGQKP